MGDFGYGMSLGLCYGVIIGMIISGIILGWGGTAEIEQLGQSICEEEYGMDFESYYNEILKCQPMKEQYDGIKVQIPVLGRR